MKFSRRNLLTGTVALGVAGGVWSLAPTSAVAASDASEDAYVSAEAPDQPTGQAAELLVQDASGGKQRVSYLKFAVPKTTGKVALRLSGAHVQEWAVVVTVHAVADQNWSEQTITWNDRPTFAEQALDRRLVGGKEVNTYEWDVTAAVRAAQAANQSAVSLAVVSNNAQEEPVRFNSRQARTALPALRNAKAAPERRRVVQGKTVSANAYRPYLATTIDLVNGFIPDQTPVPLGQYGGRSDRGLAKTGFFRVAKNSREGDSWTLVDPDGHPFISVGLASVATFSDGNADDEAAYRQKYGTDDARWARDAGDLMRRMKFNSVGGFSDDEVLRQGNQQFPYTPVLAVMNSFAQQLGVAKQNYGNLRYLAASMPVWHPEFGDYAQNYLDERLGPRRDDPWLLGWFTDNELPVSTSALKDLLAGSNGGDDPRLAESQQQARDWIVQRRGGPVDFANPDPKITDAEAGAWLGFVFDRYYEVVKPRFRNADPNHLLLGSRLHSRAPRDPDIVAAVGRHVDVLSFNYYERWEARRTDELNMWARVAPNSPALFTEFYVKGEDTGFPADQQDKGAGWIVPTQSDRGVWYQNTTIQMLRHPHVIGWQNFKFKDNANDSNKGLLRVDYSEYTEFTPAVEELNRNAYALRSFEQDLRNQAGRRGR